MRLDRGLENLRNVLVLPELANSEQLRLMGRLARLINELSNELLVNVLNSIEAEPSDSNFVDGPFPESHEVGRNVRVVMVDVGTHCRR